METPQFSVLMPVYAREKAEYLREALNSVFNQTLVPTEVVLIKDGPLTEPLETVIRDFTGRYDSLKIVALPQNVGLGAALNEGLRHCSHELVARMDSDDICKPMRFEKQVQYLMQHPQIAIVGSWIDEFYGTTDNVVAQRRLPESTQELYEYAKKRNPLNHPTVMFRKSYVECVGGYQPFYLFEDYYLWARMILAKCQLHNIQQSLLYFRSSPQVAARRGGWKYVRSEVKLQWKFLRMGLIGPFTFCKNLIIRTTVRLMPNKLRTFVYRTMLRR